MKFTFSILLAILSHNIIFAQDVEKLDYEILESKPESIPFFNLGAGFNFGLAFKNSSFTSFNYYFNSNFNFKNKVGVNLYYSRSFWVQDLSMLDSLRPKTYFEGSVFYNFLELRGKKKKVYVLLKSRMLPSINFHNSHETEESYLLVKDVDIIRSFAIQTGYSSINESVQRFDEQKIIKYTNFWSQTSGYSVGLCMTSSTNLKVQTEKYGLKSGGRLSKLHLDLLYLPKSSFVLKEGIDYGYELKKSNLGFRFVFESMPIKRKEQIRLSSYSQFEIGSRPVDGFYFTYSIGYVLNK